MRYPVEDLYNNFGTLPLTSLHKQQLLMFVYKTIKLPQTMPDAYKGYFNLNADFHSYNTRSRMDIHINSVSTVNGQRCLKFKAANLWNKLPPEIKDASVSNFKIAIQNYLSNID